jgi:NarL family two-component system response regulator LiaR
MSNQPTSKIRVVLADDHRRIHETVSQILGTDPNIYLCGQAHNGQEALDLCALVQPDIVLMDVVMPLMDGVAATIKIRTEFPDIRVLVLSSFSDNESVEMRLRSGAQGYLLKGNLVKELIPTLYATYANQSVFSREIVGQLSPKPQDFEVNRFNLTDRELEVLGLIAEGLTISQIAVDLNISGSTVKYHLSNVQDKLDVATRAEALVVASKNNLI